MKERPTCGVQRAGMKSIFLKFRSLMKRLNRLNWITPFGRVGRVGRVFILGPR
jgi:hypothetical protein